MAPLTQPQPTRTLSRRDLFRTAGAGGMVVAAGLLDPTRALALPAAAPRGDRAGWREPLVIAHRGASGYRPEHTLAAYLLAIDMGADVIEPDLVSTRDGVLVARHENEISGTTDVADRREFADRETTKEIDGNEVSGWFTEDFTFAELRTLRAIERLPDLRPGNTRFDGRFPVPTLTEVIELARRESRRRRRRIGVYPETKHPTYFAGIGLALEPPLLRELRRVGWDRRSSPAFVQSFEISNLRRLSRRSEVKLVQLVGGSGAPYDQVVKETGVTYADLVTPRGLARVARYADGIGPDKNLLIPRRADDSLGTPTDVVDDAHDEGLLVHPYTFRNENFYLPSEFDRGSDPTDHGDAIGELQAFFDIGVDGVFGDFPNTTFEARQQWLSAQRSARRAA